MIGPRVPGVGDVGLIAEEQLVQMLGAEGGQLDADARLLFHPVDFVASEATVLAHQRLAHRDCLGLGQALLDVRIDVLAAHRHQIGSQDRGLMVGKAQRRHRGMRREITRILEPGIDPAAVGFFRDRA